jgi:hypothetical protein
MEDKPPLGDRAIEAGLVLRRRALELVRERPVDLLDIDPLPSWIGSKAAASQRSALSRFQGLRRWSEQYTQDGRARRPRASGHRRSFCGRAR